MHGLLLEPLDDDGAAVAGGAFEQDQVAHDGHLPPAELVGVPLVVDVAAPVLDELHQGRLFDKGQLVKTFWDELSDVQRTVLELLEIPTSAYGQ